MKKFLYTPEASSFNKTLNISMQLKMLGLMLIIEACFMLIPLGVCIYMHEADWLPFTISTFSTGLTGILLKSLIHPKSRNMGRKDGCMLTSVVWIVFSFFGMMPFILGSSHLNVSEGFFEAMSGFTTTGATVIRDIESCGYGIMIWRALTQWVGGLGIVLFTLSIIPSLNNTKGLFMFHAEVTGITHDKIGARISNTAKTLWGIYSILTVVLIFLLWAGPMNLIESVCQAFGAISTGGFSTRNESIAAFDSVYIKVVLSIFMFIGGVNFSLVYTAMKGQFRDVWKNDVLRAYLAFIFIYYLIVLGSILLSGKPGDWQNLTINPIFHIISAMTSTGYGAGNFELWGETALVCTIIMMYFGACAGSTTGGAKIDRLLYLIKSCRIEIIRFISPRTMKAVRINNQVVTSEKTHEIVAFLLLYTSLIIVGGLWLCSFDVPIVDAFFSAISCASNNGLGAGVTGVTGSYDFLPETGKWVMSFLMLSGRLEVFALIVLMTPKFWKS
ncbi:MAG: TrkH family potassium uptake protein [Muribaculaceae bacterium]|nr:TrkH family potassium uptake protein [Muribaculaceae bacterium]